MWCRQLISQQVRFVGLYKGRQPDLWYQDNTCSLIYPPLLYCLSKLDIMFRIIFYAALLIAGSHAYDTLLKFDGAPVRENRTIEEIYQAALEEGGTVTCWHGGDETYQQNGMKEAFETRFPGMTLNISVDVSKFHDGNIDRQLSTGSLYVDSIILQTLHDYPRWDHEDVLLHYTFEF